MKYTLSLLFLAFSLIAFSNTKDTLQGFSRKLNGEEITYFSPRKQFAKTALLTRCFGNMPVSWEAPNYSGKAESVVYKLLIGHSSGTSGADRHFDISLNGKKMSQITTYKGKKGAFTLDGNSGSYSYRFEHECYDANQDAFGILYITVPTSEVKENASFSISGLNENSRDWMMVFMYDFKLKTEVKSTNLITRKENKRKLSISIDNPYYEGYPVQVFSKHFQLKKALTKGYNNFDGLAYEENFTGKDEVFVVFGKDTVKHSVIVEPVKNYTFHIIHHSHNDIGYSHVQTEIEHIQNENIRSALNWMQQDKPGGQKAIWHIESLWAVENFLRIATDSEKVLFNQAVKNGNIVLSANYANVLTGLCLDKELDWLVAYSKQLEEQYGNISSAIITDIPGITASGLRNYVRNEIQYLSLGPNYVDAYADKGDRVGGVIREQGDEIFYWKANASDTEKLMVWTAGKGYSWFHNISDADMQEKCEERISQYLTELYAENYPFEMIQLRYTKKADNGPVDLNLTDFVERWNAKYKLPQLQINSVPELFKSFEEKYGTQIPVKTGEISPYWEDGAFSTAIEESQNRILVQKTIALEDFAKKQGSYSSNQVNFYHLQRNLVLFHEHTWGSWCSTSDPDVPFTTEQWKIKKAFEDSAQQQYDRLAKSLKFEYKAEIPNLDQSSKITDFTFDMSKGGLSSVIVKDKNVLSSENYKLFEPIYMLGINPMKENRAHQFKLISEKNSKKEKTLVVACLLNGFQVVEMTFHLDKKKGNLTCHFKLNKLKERNKESLHIAFPLTDNDSKISYVSGNEKITLTKDQIAGSNHDFICTENLLFIENQNYKMQLFSPSFNLFETNGIIDENTINGQKVWKKDHDKHSKLFLYVLNNYWHTNYKADQEGIIEFDVDLQISVK